MGVLVATEAILIIPDGVTDAAIEDKAKVSSQVDVVVIERAGVAVVVITGRLTVGSQIIDHAANGIGGRVGVINAIFVSTMIGSFISANANAGEIAS